MAELTDEQLVILRRTTMGEAHEPRKSDLAFARAAIAADRELNAGGNNDVLISRLCNARAALFGRFPGDVEAINDAIDALNAQQGEPFSDGPIAKGWQLSIANGHSGYGVYAHMTEYPDEGAQLVVAIEQGSPVAWRCFHCDESFTDRAAAEIHFGKSERQSPACQISVEHYRWMEESHRRSVDEDTEALRALRTMVGEHETLRKSAEEAGYARGLSDARKHPEDIGLFAAPQPAIPQGMEVSDDVVDTVAKALDKAWQLGQRYWEQADSDSYSQNKKSDATLAKFQDLVGGVRAMLEAAQKEQQR